MSSNIDYSAFGVQLTGRNFTASGVKEFRYGFQNQEEDDEIKGEGNSYDFGARMFDPRLGRWLSTDAFYTKYPSMSPYSFAGNSPLQFKDDNGDSIIIVIWQTGGGPDHNSFGHAGIAIQNYKTVTKTYTHFGITLTVTERVPDGTYTYYDLWPATGVSSDKEGTTTPVGADYQEFTEMKNGVVITEEQLMNSDPSRNEKYAPDGVIKLYTDGKMDGTVKAALEKHRIKNPKYIGATNNCSNYIDAGVEIVFKDDITEDKFGKESYFGNDFVTPNELFKDTEKLVKETGKGKVIKKTGKFDRPFFDGAKPAKEHSQAGKVQG